MIIKLTPPMTRRTVLSVSVVLHLLAPGALAGYCNWGPLGTAASSTCDCDGNVQCEGEGGTWCNVNQERCEGIGDAGCEGRWCTNDGGPTPPTGPNTPNPTPPPVSGPTPPTSGSTATTTRYWDCSGGACACSFVPTGMSDQQPVHCHSNAMFVAPPGNIHGASYYGAAAISQALGGGNWDAEGCGKCWKVTGTSNMPGYGDGVTSTLVLKGTNFCPPENAPCSGDKAHFDIAAPGFDVAQFSLSNTCSQREPDEVEGFGACSRWRIDNNDPTVGCDCNKFDSVTLREGCQNFRNLNWDNPTVAYEEVVCPIELSSLHCSYPYALEATMPATCPSNDYATTPNSTPVPTNNPTDNPTVPPTNRPTTPPTDNPTGPPTSKPTTNPTDNPTGPPTDKPTMTPTGHPSLGPILSPTPSKNPTSSPTRSPTDEPTHAPTDNPSKGPSSSPTEEFATSPPTRPPVTQAPTKIPTSQPSDDPTRQPSGSPMTIAPTNNPTDQPTGNPTNRPTERPTLAPNTDAPTNPPTRRPTLNPQAASGDPCCSWDFSTCGTDDWCNHGRGRCEGSCNGSWITPGASCTPLYGECTGQAELTSDCCNPTGTVTCKGDSSYAQCLE